MINDNIAEELLVNEGYSKIYDNLDGYKAYQKGYCNCGSFVGALIDKKGMAFKEATEISKKEKLSRLYQIKSYMSQPGYKDRKEEFLQKQGVLTEELQAYDRYIRDYEIKQTIAIQEKYSGQDLMNQMSELYNELGSMNTNLQEQPDYKRSHENYMNFLKDYELMNESWFYYLTKEEEEIANKPGVPPIPDYLKIKDETDMELEAVIEIPEVSTVIDEVIEREENENKYIQYQDEYSMYDKLFHNLLIYVPSFLFATIWSEPDELKNIKTVPIDSLIIDDLAFMNYDEMICIIKE